MRGCNDKKSYITDGFKCRLRLAVYPEEVTQRDGGIVDWGCSGEIDDLIAENEITKACWL